MNAKVSEQDLADYSLNELGPEERIYVETVLGGSEEAREDVYQMIDLAMMLDRGFEKQQSSEPAVLTLEQRRALMSVQGPNIFLRNSAAVLAAAACVAFAIVQRDAWMPRLHMPQATATAGAAADSGMQASAVIEETDFVTQLKQFRQLTDDPFLRKWFSTLPGGTSPVPVMNFDTTAHGSFDSLMP